MAKPPKRQTTPKPKPRTHLPALNPLELEAFTARLLAVKGISNGGKRVVLQSMRAAANTQAETPTEVIKTLEPEEQRAIAAASADYARTLSAMGSRGRLALMADAEFDALVASQDEEE